MKGEDAAVEFRVPRPAPSDEPARWLRRQLTGAPGTTASVVPTSFAAYARVFHPAGGHHGREVRWADVASMTGRSMHPLAQYYGLDPSAWQRRWSGAEDVSPPDTGDLPPRQLALLHAVLERHTPDAMECFFAVWEGFGDLPHNKSRGTSAIMQAVRVGSGPVPDPEPVPLEWELDIAHAARVVHPNRTYVLFTGALDDVLRLRTWHTRDWWLPRPPNLWWPADHSWCVATEIDFDSTLVGGSRALVDDLLRDAGLESAEVRPEHKLIWGSDPINPEPDYW